MDCVVYSNDPMVFIGNMDSYFKYAQPDCSLYSKVSNLGVKSLLPFHAWLFQCLKKLTYLDHLTLHMGNIIKLRSSVYKFIGFVKKSQQNWKSFNQTNINFHYRGNKYFNTCDYLYSKNSLKKNKGKYILAQIFYYVRSLLTLHVPQS
jgi:hypothetical protein